MIHGSLDQKFGAEPRFFKAGVNDLAHGGGCKNQRKLFLLQQAQINNGPGSTGRGGKLCQGMA